MKKNTPHYEFERGFKGIEDYASFLEYVVSKGYELRIIFDNYLLELVSKRLDRIRFINDYSSVCQHALTIHNRFGNRVAECDRLSEFKLLDIGGELETLIEHYIS